MSGFENEVADKGIKVEAENGKTYYVNANGVMAEGWNQVGGQWYYFYPGSGEKAVNTVIDGFPVDAQGIWHRESMTR